MWVVELGEYLNLHQQRGVVLVRQFLLRDHLHCGLLTRLL